MHFKVNDEINVDLWESGWPIWVHVNVKGSSASLTDHELRCLISACTEALKERGRMEYMEYEKELIRDKKRTEQTGI